MKKNYPPERYYILLGFISLDQVKCKFYYILRGYYIYRKLLMYSVGGTILRLNKNKI